MVYRAIVKRKARGIFDALSRGDVKAVTADLAEDVHTSSPATTPSAASATPAPPSKSGCVASTA